jgi:putative phosphoserine phosphatase/1-acylglycerol-3-phosphate O-acyltransferase
MIAFFDIDGTITRHSSERRLLKLLLKQGHLGVGDLVRAGSRFLFRHPVEFFQTGFKTNKSYLSGLSEQTLTDAARRCFEMFVRNDIRPALRAEIAARKANGARIVLLSGSLPQLVRPLADELGTDDFICSALEVREGRLTGRMTDLHPYADRKRVLAERYCQKNGSQLSEAAAYGNEGADLFLLNAVKEPVAVCPDTDLRHWARHHGWRIMECES